MAQLTRSSTGGHGVISSHLPKWAKSSSAEVQSPDRLPVQDVTNRLNGNKSCWKVPVPEEVQLFTDSDSQDAVRAVQSNCRTSHRYTKPHGVGAADAPGDTPTPSSVSGDLSAAPTGFSSDARRVVASLAPAWQDRLDPSRQTSDLQRIGRSPLPTPTGTGWSALYDDSSDEEALQGLHAEPSQASILSFQPHNLFEEHFATAAAASPTPLADGALGMPAPQSPSTRNQAQRMQFVQSSSAAQQQQQESPAPANLPKVKPSMGLSTEGAVGKEQQSDEPLMSSPAVLGGPRGAMVGGRGGLRPAPCDPGAAQHVGSQSPMGKPPLPTSRRLTDKGSKLSPRCSAGTPRSPSVSPRLGSAIPRPPSALSRVSTNTCHRLLAAGGPGAATNPHLPGENTPCTPVARRAGRSNTGRGLASDLQGMEAQLADLDAMWSVVNAPKLEHTAGSKEARKDQHKQSKPSSAAGAAKMRQQQLPSSQGLHSRAPAQPPSTAAQAASTGSFPGFSVLPSQKVATAAPAGTGKPSSRRIGARPSCPPESSILQPALSQEPELPCYSSARKGMGSHGAKENLSGIGSMVRPNSARLSHTASTSQLWPPAQQSLRHSTGSLKAALANPSMTNVAKVGQAQSHRDSPPAAAKTSPQPSEPVTLSPFSGKSPHGQLQLLENMFQALPQRQAKRAQQPHAGPATAGNDHHVAHTTTGGFSQPRIDIALHCSDNSQQPCVASMVLREVLGKAQATAAQESNSSLKQPDSGTTLQSHHAFRLSFSPTGIPTVEPHQQLGTQAPPLEPIQAAALEPTQHQGPHVQPPGPEHHVGTQAADRAASPASGSAINSHACRASGTPTAVSPPSSGTAVLAATPKATSSAHPNGAGKASPRRIHASRGGDGGHALVQAEAHQLQQLPTDSPAGADCSRHQAASPQSGAEAQVEAKAVAMGTASPAQPELPLGQSAAAKSAPPTAKPSTQAAPEAPAHASTPVAGGAGHSLRSDTPCGPPCSMLPPPSTPMLAWLDALGTPGSSLLSNSSQPSLGRQGVAAAHEEHVPFGSMAQAQMDKSQLPASPGIALEAVPNVVSSPAILPKACADLPHLSSSSLPSPTDALSEKASSIPAAVPDQATPSPLPDQAMPGLLPHQATPSPLPTQATPMLHGNTQNSFQGTPHGWTRRATPHVGPPTGLSGLTTPASAAEMHRCYPGVGDLDASDDEDTVLLENPAYENLMRKCLKGPVSRRHLRHPLLDLGQLASNPAFESEAGTLSARNMDTPRRPTPAPTAHPNRHTPTKIAYRPNAHPSSADRLTPHSRQKAHSPQPNPMDPTKNRVGSPSRPPAVGSLKLAPFSPPPTGPTVSLPASSAPAAGLAAASEALVKSEATPAGAAALQLDTANTQGKIASSTVQQEHLRVDKPPFNAMSAPVNTAVLPVVGAAPVGLQASPVPGRSTHAAEPLLGSGSKAPSGTSPPAQHGRGLSEVSSSPADKAAQHHTVALFGQNPEDRNATAAGSTASSPPGSDPAPVATPGAPQGTSPAERIGPALGPRSGLGAMPLQTSSTSQKSHSSSVSVKTQGAAVMDGAEGDMYAVSDALLLDNISAAAAASQGSAGRKQSGCASRQTEAASSSSITPSTKGSQEVSSKGQSSNPGKSKRWSPLAFWKRGSAKAKKMPKAAAASSAASTEPKAEEVLQSLRQRSSNYNSSFIALAKRARAKPKAAATARSSQASFTCFHASAVASGDNPRHTPQDTPQHTQQAAAPASSVHPKPGDQLSTTAAQVPAALVEGSAQQTEGGMGSCASSWQHAAEMQQSMSSVASLPRTHNAQTDTALPDQAPQQRLAHEGCLSGHANNGPVAGQGRAAGTALLGSPATPSWRGSPAGTPPTPLNSHPIDALDGSEDTSASTSATDAASDSLLAHSGQYLGLLRSAESEAPFSPALTNMGGPTHDAHLPAQDLVCDRAYCLQAGAQPPQHGSLIPRQGRACPEGASLPLEADTVMLEMESDLSVCADGLISPASSAASWPRHLAAHSPASLPPSSKLTPSMPGGTGLSLDRRQQLPRLATNNSVLVSMYPPEARAEGSSGLCHASASMFAAAPLGPGLWHYPYQPLLNHSYQQQQQGPATSPSSTAWHQQPELQAVHDLASQSSRRNTATDATDYAVAAAQLRQAVAQAEQLYRASTHVTNPSQTAGTDAMTAHDQSGAACSRAPGQGQSPAEGCSYQPPPALPYSRRMGINIQHAMRRAEEPAYAMQPPVWVPQGQGAGNLCLPSCRANEEQLSAVQAGQQRLRQEMQTAILTLQHALQQQRSDNDNAAVMAG